MSNTMYPHSLTYTLDGETREIHYKKYISYEDMVAIIVQVASLVAPGDGEYKPYLLSPALAMYCLEYFSDSDVESLSYANRLIHETTLWDDLYTDCSMIQDIERDVARIVRHTLRKSKADDMLDALTSLIRRVDDYAADLPDMNSMVDLLRKVQETASNPSKLAEVVQLLQNQKGDVK